MVVMVMMMIIDIIGYLVHIQHSIIPFSVVDDDDGNDDADDDNVKILK